MRKLLALTLLIGCTTLTYGQVSKGNGKLSGQVRDAANNTPVEYATIALVDIQTSKPVDGSVADGDGKFTINKIADGKYNVVVSFIGFEASTITVTFDDKNNNLDLGIIKINSKAEMLNEVTVQGQKTLIEERVDRTVYNAENDLTTRGGDATDVLKRVPMLSVDLDGNVSMRGNSNIRVLINNRPSAITASSIADALKQIPADEIKSVEVITSPSAKYDAEGSAGIINIITKKNVLEGATLNVNSSAGIRGSNLGLNGAYKKGKVGLTLGGFGRAGYNVKGNYENIQKTIDENDVQRINTQYADTKSNFVFGRYTLGLDYDINKNNYINSSVQFGLRNNDSFQDNLLTRTFENGSLVSSGLRGVDTKNNSGSVDVNFGFTHLYEKPQRELSIMGLYSRNNRTNNFINSSLDEVTEDVLNRTKNINESFDQEVTFQVDYQTPIQKNQMIEFGAKQIMRTVSSDYEYFQATGSNGPFIPSDNVALTNVFNYNQNISAGYLSYTLSFLTDYSLKAGARYEYTTIDANFSDENNVEIPSYGVLVPSINASRKLANGNTLKASYNRRIQRPSIRYLNPNLQQSNQLSQTIGNPKLDPEYTNNFELSYSSYIKGSSLNFSTFVRNTNNSIQSLRQVVGQDTILTTYQNIGREDAYGMSIFANVNIGGKFSLNGGTDFYYAVLDNNDPNPEYTATNEGWVISGRLFGNYTLPKNWAIQFFGFYRGNQVQLQGTQGGFGIYSLGLNKTLGEDKRGSIGFGAENFFNTSGFKMKTELISPTIAQSSVNVMYNMNFKINFSYRFGKISADSGPRRRKKTVSNDDLKGGGGDDNTAGDSPQPARSGGGNFQAPAGGKVKPKIEKAPVDPSIPTANVEGTWKYTLDSPQGGKGTFMLKKDGEKYTGTISSDRMPAPTELSSVSVNGNELTFTYQVSFGPNPVTVEVVGIVTENEIAGDMTFGTFRTVPMKASKE